MTGTMQIVRSKPSVVGNVIVTLRQIQIPPNCARSAITGFRKDAKADLLIRSAALKHCDDVKQSSKSFKSFDRAGDARSTKKLGHFKAPGVLIALPEERIDEGLELNVVPRQMPSRRRVGLAKN